MSEEDKKLQKHLVDEMMKVYETNPDVMLYMQSLMENYEKLEQENKQLKVKSEVLEENNKLLIQQKAQMYKDLDIAYEKIDKANELLSKIVVREREDGNWGAVKNTRKQDVYETIWKLYEILDTSSYERNEMLKILGDKENDNNVD